MKPLPRLSADQYDSDYCPWMHGGSSALGEIKVYLKDSPDAVIYFEAVDQVNREATIFVFGPDGNRIGVGDGCLKATLKDVDVVIEMSPERRAEVEAYLNKAEVTVEDVT